MATGSSTFRSLRQFVTAILRSAPRLAGATIVLTFAVGLFEGVGLLALVPLLQLVGLDAQQGALGGILSLFRTAFAFIGLTPTLPAVLASYVVIVSVQSVLQRWGAVVQTRLREQIVHDLRTRLYRAIAGTTWVYFSRHRASTFGQMLTQRVDRVANAAYYLLDLFVTGVVALAYAAVAFRVSPLLTLFVAACGAALLVTLRGRLADATRTGEAYTDASVRLHNAAFDHLDSMKMAKGYGAGQRHAEHFSRLSSEMGAASRRAMDASVATRQWVTIGSALLLAVLVYVAQAVMQLSAASLFLLIFLFARLVPRVTALYEKAQVLLLDLPSFQSLIDAEARCLEAAEPPVATHGSMALDHAVACRHVTFGYGVDQQVAALCDVSLTIRAHATTAIVGPSGAGKSTFADLLMGLLAPAAGVILVDDMPLTPDRLQAWRRGIGYVSQETFLFHDTVRANLTWAAPGADDSRVWRALEQAAAADFVRALSQGLDTVVGDRGVLLSGGERQRLSLARALLREPRLLILDEATSSLDSENERRIQAAIEQLHEQITIVVITHRLSTIRNADEICVIDGGRLVESGTWDGLMIEPSGRFRALCDAQGIERPSAAAGLQARPAPAVPVTS